MGRRVRSDRDEVRVQPRPLEPALTEPVPRLAARAEAQRRKNAISRALLGLGGVLLTAYAAPLFYPPRSFPLGHVVPPDAWLLARIFPSVPPLWVALRLVALAAAALLLTGGRLSAALRSLRSASSARHLFPLRAARPLALGVAVLHACAAPWAGRLGPAGQTVYLVMLGLPALLLALPEPASVPPRPRHLRRTFPIAAVIVLWSASRLVTDLGSPRIADVVDGWRGWLDIYRFVAEKKNLLRDLFDPKLPGMGGMLLFLHGVPLVHLGIAPLSFRWFQVLQIVSLAVCAAGVGAVARLLLGTGVSLVAVAAFLFAPYTRFMALFPGPFVAGPVYITLVALCALVACRRKSEAALAALGAASGIAVAFPGVVPSLAVFLAVTAWYLRASWPRVWLGCVTGLASFAAAVVPALGNVLRPGELKAHFRWDGLISIIDGNLLGQLPLGTLPPAWWGVSPRPFDVVVSAALAPFAHPRLAIRLWGDAIFDPVGGALIALGLVACVRATRRSSAARILLLFFVASLAPAFVSPVDIVDIVHAVTLPVPAALLAAAGFAALSRQLGGTLARSKAAAVTAVAICLGGTVLFDVVNPRILSASSFGIMFSVLKPEEADRVVVLVYGPGFVRPTRTLFWGPITTFGGPRPVGYFEYDGGELPASGFAAEGKDLLFWSHGYDLDMDVVGAICRQWPAAAFFEIWDQARLGRVHGALIGGAPWWPRVADARWRAWNCASREGSRE